MVIFGNFILFLFIFNYFILFCRKLIKADGEVVNNAQWQSYKWQGMADW